MTVLFRRSLFPAVLACGLLAAPPALAFPRFCASADTIPFGNHAVGTRTTATVTITSCGSRPWTFTDVSLHERTGSGFAVDTSCATGLTLSPGESCRIDVAFVPMTAGQTSGALWLHQTSTTPDQLVTFYGRGVSSTAGTSSARFSPAVVDLGAVTIGAVSEWHSVTLVNESSAPLTPTALVINGTNPYDFATISYGDARDCAVGRAIGPGTRCTLNFTFRPRARGSRSAQLVVDAPELASLITLPLQGTGVDAALATVEVIEFFHRERNHYFVTTEPAEAAMIEAGGVGPGWERTGHTFRVWPAIVRGAPVVTVDACRFFGASGIGPDAHFFTAFGAECAALRENAAWTFEGIGFRVVLPNAGRCDGGFDPVVRLYWPGTTAVQVRHRYVVDAEEIAGMAARGWIVEGPVFCSPRGGAGAV